MKAGLAHSGAGPLFPSSEARGKASSVKLLDQPLAGLNGKLRVKPAVKLGETIS